MGFESFESYEARQESEPALDEELFERYKELKVNVIPNVKPDQESLRSQKEEFLSEEIECPEFQYSKVTKLDFNGLETGLLQLKAELRNEENFEAQHQAYLWSINERLAKLRMLRELAEAQDSENLEDHQRRFKRYAEFIYGKPEKEMFDSVLSSLENKLEDVDPETNPEAYQRLATLTEEAEEQKISAEFPEGREGGDEMIETAEEVKGYLEDAISEMKLEGWAVEIDKEGSRSNVGVIPNKKVVRIPNTEQLRLRASARKMTLNTVRGLIVHELGTHALRNYNGYRSRLKLLSVGLDRYEVGEEGLATFREQHETGTDDYAGFDNYFAAGLAYGLDGQERHFGQVFSILKDYYEVCDSQPEEDAKELAFKRCLKIFRGTPGNVPGLIFPKDIIYRKGNMETYKLRDTESFEKIDFNAGKFDPSNDRHVMLLVEMGILDQDLDYLKDSE